MSHYKFVPRCQIIIYLVTQIKILPHISITKRAQIVVLKDNNFTFEQIKNILNVNISTAHAIYKKYKNYATYNNLPKSGRKRKVNLSGERRLIRMVKKNRFMSAAEITNNFNIGIGQSVRSKTVRKILHKYGIKGCAAAKKKY